MLVRDFAADPPTSFQPRRTESLRPVQPAIPPPARTSGRISCWRSEEVGFIPGHPQLARTSQRRRIDPMTPNATSPTSRHAAVRRTW